MIRCEINSNKESSIIKFNGKKEEIIVEFVSILKFFDKYYGTQLRKTIIKDYDNHVFDEYFKI